MKNKLFLIAIILFSTVQFTAAQTDSLFWNRDMNKIATPTSNADWINIKPEITIDPLTFFTTQKKALAMGTNDEMQLYKTETDKFGNTHYRYQQFYKGYKIIFGEFLLHARDGKLITANGKMIKGLKKNPVVSISKAQALGKALYSFPALKYAWEIPELEQEKKLISHDVNATFKPIGELVWISAGPGENINDPRYYSLCYMFDIFTASLYGKRIFVDAASGNIIKSLPLVQDCTATNVTTNFYSVQSFSTRQIPGSNPAIYNLWNDCQGAFIHTRLWNSTLANSTDYTSGINNSWSAVPSAATSLWCMERALNYFAVVHNRNGWDNAGGGVNIYQDALFCGNPPTCSIINNANNASFSSGFMLVGNSGNAAAIDDWNTLDIIAHEFTHGVTQTTAGLIYSKESGALNESFSDIFGATCHASLFGLSGNTWLVGYDRKNPANTALSLYIRNMANPSDKNDPDTYLGVNWVSTTTPTDVGGDNWGVHTNSGPQNLMYKLLVSGGTGTNDNGVSYSCLGIGIAAARDLAYNVLRFYLTSTSQYTDARNAWVRAAVDAYGACSFQAIEAGKAWDAVGLPPPVNNQTTPYCGTYGNAVFSVTSPSTYSLAPGCAMTVNAASLVQFGANKVILNPGFRANNTSHFRAYISDCRYSTY